MWFGCRQPDAVVSQAYPGMLRCVLAFLHLRQSSSLLHLGKRDFGYYGVTVARLGLSNKGGKSALTGFKYMLGLSMYGGGH